MSPGTRLSLDGILFRVLADRGEGFSFCQSVIRDSRQQTRSTGAAGRKGSVLNSFPLVPTVQCWHFPSGGCKNKIMGRLKSALQELHEGGKPLEITWFWDDGVDVKAGDEIRNFGSVSEILPWLQHWYSLTPEAQRADALEAELQKIYDSEINVTLRVDGDRIFVALGNDFTGFDAHGKLTSAANVLPWIQKAIHKHYPMSQYDLERLGGTFTCEMAENLQ